MPGGFHDRNDEGKVRKPQTKIICFNGYAHAQPACFEPEKWVEEADKWIKEEMEQ